VRTYLGPKVRQGKADSRSFFSFVPEVQRKLRSAEFGCLGDLDRGSLSSVSGRHLLCAADEVVSKGRFIMV
jgi:hypothetical protein